MVFIWLPARLREKNAARWSVATTHRAAREVHVVDVVKAKVPRGQALVKSVRRRKRRQWLPYVLLIPAVVMELLIHIIPMLVGVAISFFKLTQLYLGNWRQAPFAGLDNRSEERRRGKEWRP